MNETPCTSLSAVLVTALKLGTHYSCSRAVNTTREHGCPPVNTGVILDTRPASRESSGRH